jgi:hypothetical protein
MHIHFDLVYHEFFGQTIFFLAKPAKIRSFSPLRDPVFSLLVGAGPAASKFPTSSLAEKTTPVLSLVCKDKNTSR